MINLDLTLPEIRFVVVDVETTGGTGGDHKLIEVAFLVIEGGCINASFSSLINPHTSIPEFISVMTGITDAMVEDAPDEDEAVAPLITELCKERTVFVAHNVGFDWSLISASIIHNGGLIPDIARLCTCKLSRRLNHEIKRHDLATVAEFCGVEHNHRHRALGDTEATASSLLKMIERAVSEYDAVTLGDLLALQYAPRIIPRRESKARAELAPYLNEIPEEPGVYYFLSSKRRVLYVGKAKNLAQRVKTYFHDAPLHGRSVSRMIRYIKHITWKTTGTELGAMLLESAEIKRILPTYNVASREYRAPNFLRFTNEAFPRLELVNHVDADGSEYFGPFRSEFMASRIRDSIMRAYKLRSCDGELHPAADNKPCFDYHIKRCYGPCALLQSHAEYLSAATDAKQHLTNLESGAVAALKQKMEEAAANLEFEHAAMMRDGLREIERMMMLGGEQRLAVTDINVVIAVPTQYRNTSVEIFALHSGRLRLQRIIAVSESLDGIVRELADIYAMPPLMEKFSDRELDELRIITSWLHQRKEQARTFVAASTNFKQLDQQLSDLISRTHA